MQNIDVRFNATSNFGKVKGDLAALEAQAASLNATFAKNAYAKSPLVVDQKAWKRGSDAVTMASRVYLQAASSSGILTAQQIKATSEAERYTQALQKQKLSIGDMMRHRGIMRQVYQDQLRYQRMTAQYWGTDPSGRAVTSITIPKNVPRDLDTMRKRVGMVGNMFASAGTQVVNLGKNIQWAGRQLTVGFTYPVVLFGAAAGVAAYKAEAGFARINKVYDVSNAALNSMTIREKELGKLRVQSMQMAGVAAAKYGATLNSTLQVEQELAATGLKGQNLLHTTSEVQRISALGDIDPAQTTKMVVALGTAFRSTIPDAAAMTNTLNFMNAASNATSLSLQDIAEATPRAASGLAALGVDARQMTIMLVSMREAGVDAAEGAQALKSATARILNPTIVAKATKMFSGFGANIDIAKLSEQAKGNFYDFIQLLGAAEAKEKNLTNQQKNSANAALFGTYQFNRLTAVLKNMWDAQNGVNNQTAKAIKLTGLSNEELAKQAELSRKAMMENPAGRFRAEWAKLQIELVDVGKVFLEIATNVLGAFSSIADAFNGMDNWKKKTILVGVGLLALAGPVIMLTGLFLNLFGQFTKGIGSLLKFIGISKLVTKEEQMATLSAEAQNKAMMAQTDAASTLAAELQVLSAAYREASATAAGYLAEGAVGPRPAIGTATTAHPVGQTARPSGVPVSIQGTTASYLRPEAMRGGRASERDMQVINARARAETERGILKTQHDQFRQETANTRIQEKMRSTSVGTGTALGVGAVAMGAMMVNSNHTADTLLKWVLAGTFIVPAMKAAAMWSAATAKSAWETAAAQMASSRASTAGAINTVKTAGFLNAMKSGALGLGKAIGPTGLVTIGVLAVGAGIMAWRNHIKAVEAEQYRLYTSINNMTDTWAQGVGKVKAKYQDIADIQHSIVDTGKTQNLYDTYSTGAMKKTTSDFKGLSGRDQDLAAAQHFMDLQVKYKMTAREASANIVALYEAAGFGAVEANKKAEALLDTIGKITQQKKGLYLQNQIDIFGTMAPDSKQAKDAAKDIAVTFKDAFANADPLQAKALVAQFVSVASDGWKTSYKNLTDTYSNLPSIFASMGIKSAKNLQDAVAAAGGANAFVNLPAFKDQPVEMLGAIVNGIRSASTEEKMFVSAMASGGDTIGKELGSNVDSIKEFTNAWIIATNIMDRQSGMALVGGFNDSLKDTNSRLAAMGAIGKTSLGDIAFSFDTAAQSQQMLIVNMLNANNGFAQGKTLAEAIYNYMNKVTPAAQAAAAAAKNLGGALKGVPTSINIKINKKEFISAYRTGMDAVQNEMVESADASFDSRWDARMARAEAGNQRAEDGAKRRHQAALDRIQAQIDAEKKADQIRQRLFDAEKTRLQRLAEMQNKNIDFNQAINEGRLDDAAKIQNDMQAQTAINAMDDEDKRAQALSDAKVARLEAQSKRLEKIQQRQEAAAQRGHEAQMKNMQKERDYQKAMLDQRLELFKAYTARNQKDLERWMKVVGLSYDDFGTSVKAKGKSWSEFFRTELATQIRLAATQVANDNMWKTVTADMVRNLLNGMGFPNLPAFIKFMNTGKLPKGFGTATTPTETHHTGGIVGSGGGSRGSVPSNYSGLHPSEVMVRAQKGERIVDRRNSNRYSGVLDAISNGTLPNGVMGGQNAADSGTTRNILPIYGMVAGGIANMFKTGLGSAFNRIVQKRLGAGAGAGPGATNAAIADQQTAGAGFKPGAGGRHRPINAKASSGIHDVSTGYPALDFAASIGHPIFAVGDGTITRSYDIKGYEARRAGYGKAQDGYKSYGRVVYLHTGSGPEVLYAHLSRRSVVAGQNVKGGSVIGYSGDTGNSTGPHLHFGSSGASPYAWLRRGGKIRWDNTPVIAHKGETMLSAALTKKFEDNVASEGGTEYNVTIDLRGAYIKEDIDVAKAMDAWWSKKDAKTGRKRVIH